jgi:hypothetical protein
MRGTMILPAAITIVLATATGAFAQNMQYDRTGDHLVSYGTTPYANYSQAPVGPTKVHVERHGKRRATATLNVPVDRTSDHMLYYGPIAQ